MVFLVRFFEITVHMRMEPGHMRDIILHKGFPLAFDIYLEFQDWVFPLFVIALDSYYVSRLTIDVDHQIIRIDCEHVGVIWLEIKPILLHQMTNIYTPELPLILWQNQLLLFLEGTLVVAEVVLLLVVKHDAKNLLGLRYFGT